MLSSTRRPDSAARSELCVLGLPPPENSLKRLVLGRIRQDLLLFLAEPEETCHLKTSANREVCVKPLFWAQGSQQKLVILLEYLEII